MGKNYQLKGERDATGIVVRLDIGLFTNTILIYM